MRRAPLLLLLALPLPLAAQAPVITPAGDPSVKSDTIYRLAVKPADYPDQPFVYLLDDGVVRFEADGRGTRTYRQIVQVFTREAAEQWGEQTFSYDSSREKLTVNWIRVLRPDGTVISSQPSHEQESISEVAEDAPVYSDLIEHRVSLGGVAPNTLVDYSYTVETRKPVMPGDYHTSWSVITGRYTRRSRLVVDLPASVTPRIKEENLHFPRLTTESRGRRVYTWATQEVARVEPELYAASPNTVSVTINVSAPISWGDIARWYARLSADRYQLTPDLERELSGVVASAKTLEDSVRAVHRWVAQDFRYVSLSLGIGGYRPRLPGDVFTTKYGDCKDKATLFITAMRRFGLTAYPVLLAASGGVDSTIPTPSQFDHMIAAVKWPGAKGYRYFDLTSELTPSGDLPPDEQGEFGLVVHSDGTGETITFPEDSVGANRDETLIAGNLAPDGSFTGRITETTTGTKQYSLRGAFTTPYDSTGRDRLARAIANSVFEGASGSADSLQIFDGRDWSAEPKVSAFVSGGHATSSAGGQEILTLPIHDYASPGLVSDLRSRGPRKFPIDVAAVTGPGLESYDLRLTLPAGWRARLPSDVSSASDFGSYTATYAQDGRVLRVVRRIEGRKGTEPPSKIGALIDWLAALAKDDVKYIVIEHGND